MSFKNQFLTALYRFGSYPELLDVKGIRVFLYTFFTVILSVVFMVLTAAPGYLSQGGLEGMAKKYIPEFSVKDGKLKTEKIDFSDPVSGVRIYVDTSAKMSDAPFADEGYSCVLVADSDEIYVYNSMQGSQKMRFDEMGIDFSSDDIYRSLADKRVAAFIIALFIFTWIIGMSFYALYNIIFLALIGNIINMVSARLPLNFGHMLKLACYARTLPLIMSLLFPVIAGIGFNPAVFYAVGGFYMYKALKNIRLNTGVVIADISGMSGSDAHADGGE